MIEFFVQQSEINSVDASKLFFDAPAFLHSRLLAHM